MHQLLLNRDIYTEFVQNKIPAARNFLWLITADIKDLHVETDSGFEPFLGVLAELVERGVAVRLMHAKEPRPEISRRLRQLRQFDQQRALRTGTLSANSYQSNCY